MRRPATQVLQQSSHSDWVLDTVFTHKGDQLVSVGRDMSAKLTEVATQRFIDNISSITPGALRGGLQTVARHPQRDEFLVGGADGVPQAYRIVRKVQRHIGDNALCIRKWPAMEGRVYAVRFAPDGKSFAAVSSSMARARCTFTTTISTPRCPPTCWRSRAGMKGRARTRKRRVLPSITSARRNCSLLPRWRAALTRLAYRPDGAVVAVGGEDGKVRLIRAADGAVEKEFIPVPLVTTAVR